MPQVETLDHLSEQNSSFRYSFYFLAKPQRQAVRSLYMFCRLVDDIVDQTKSPEVCALKLNWWEAEFTRIYESVPQHPVGIRLQPVVQAYQLDRADFMSILEGMRMDLNEHSYQNFDALCHYCYCVAGVVGKLFSKIIGCNRPQSFEYATTLGRALQLTNIIRDVGEDLRRQRIYLPLDELEQFKVSTKSLINLEPSPQFEALMRFQIKRAKAIHHQAHALLPREDFKLQTASRVMAHIYYALLLEIEKSDLSQLLSHKILIKKRRKLYLAFKVWLFSQMGIAPKLR